MALAKDKWPPGKGKPAHAANPGKGPKAIPPGQIKRYTRGAKLPPGLDYRYIDDLTGWRLPPPGPGYRYVRVDNEVLRVTRDTLVVMEALGIVSDLFN